MEGANGKVDGAAAAVTVIDGEEGLVWIAVEAVDRNQLVLATKAHIFSGHQMGAEAEQEYMSTLTQAQTYAYTDTACTPPWSGGDRSRPRATRPRPRATRTHDDRPRQHLRAPEVKVRCSQ